MLVLKINEGEKIKMGDNIDLLFKWNSGQHAIDVCIDAPKEFGISRISEHEKNKAKESNMCVDDLIYNVEKEKAYI